MPLKINKNYFLKIIIYTCKARQIGRLTNCNPIKGIINPIVKDNSKRDVVKEFVAISI